MRRCIFCGDKTEGAFDDVGVHLQDICQECQTSESEQLQLSIMATKRAFALLHKSLHRAAEVQAAVGEKEDDDGNQES